MDQITLHLSPQVLGWIAALGLLHNFMNNLAANIPALKGNTWFQCLAGGINALVETAQGTKTVTKETSTETATETKETASPN